MSGLGVDPGEFRHRWMVKLDGTADFISYFFDNTQSYQITQKLRVFIMGTFSRRIAYAP